MKLKIEFIIAHENLEILRDKFDKRFAKPIHRKLGNVV